MINFLVFKSDSARAGEFKFFIPKVLVSASSPSQTNV